MLTSESDNRYLLSGVAASLVLHVLLVYLLSIKPKPIVPTIQPIFVNMVSLDEPKKEPQIESPPESKSDVENPEANYLSDINSLAQKETIKRGDGPDAGAIVSKPSKAEAASVPKARSAPQPKQPKQDKPSSEAKIKTLSLDTKTLIENFSEKQPDQAEAKNLDAELNASKTTSLSVYQPFSRPQGSGAAFLGSAGSNDYLPNLPDGDITLLNTKASQYAVFVRRVATQVFGQLRVVGWDKLRAQDIMAIRAPTEVHATLSKQGKLLAIKLVSESGSSHFDHVLVEGVQLGAQDQNPPLAALSKDGKFHFIFQAKSWSRLGTGRTGAPYERRWLVLATGLE